MTQHCIRRYQPTRKSTGCQRIECWETQIQGQGAEKEASHEILKHKDAGQNSGHSSCHVTRGLESLLPHVNRHNFLDNRLGLGSCGGRTNITIRRPHQSTFLQDDGTTHNIITQVDAELTLLGGDRGQKLGHVVGEQGARLARQTTGKIGIADTRDALVNNDLARPIREVVSEYYTNKGY